MKSPSSIRSFGKLALLLGSTLSTTGIALAQDAPAIDIPPTDEIVVRGTNIPNPQRATSEVVSVLSAEDIIRSGDDNAAEALKRLSGLSVVGGKYVYVRGLGDRYSSALLNGSPLPSTEPLRRQVPLDLFPSNILQGAIVQKTFSADYPGEFGGGVIDLQTLRTPSEPFFTLKLGTGLNTVSTGEGGLVYRGSSADWTGLGGSIRNVPDALQAAIDTGQKINASNFTAAELETIGESFVNTPLTLIQSDTLEPDAKFEATAGTTIDMGDNRLGLVGVFGYSSQQRNLRDVCRQNVVVGNLESSFCPDFNNGAAAPGVTDNLGQPLGYRITTWDIVANAFASATLELGDYHSITATALVVRSTQKRAEIGVGTSANQLGSTDFLHRERTAWYERQLADFQLLGNHTFGNLDLKWRTSAAESRRDAPYERDLTRIETPANPIDYNENDGGNETHFSYLNDQVFSAGADASYTMALSDYRDAVFSAGFDYSKTDRDYTYRNFVFALASTSPSLLPDTTNRADYLFQPDAIRPDGFQIQEVTVDNDSYDAQLEVKAAYVNADVEIVPLVHISGGVRYEYANEKVQTFNTYGAPVFPQVKLKNDYFLPAATFTWNFGDNKLLRLGYSQTIARPQFRELAFSPYVDPETGRFYRGNPFLVDSKFRNYDARLEWYFGRTQYATLAGFYKDIDNPIEQVIVPTQGDFDTRFINAPQAKLFGGEIEYRINFEMPWKFFALDPAADWLFSVNYTYTHSEVQVGNELINDPTRQPSQTQLAPASNFIVDGSRLQGTPTHIVNTQFGYQTDRQQTTILLGWVSDRVARRGLGQVAPVIEKPGVILDVVHKEDITIGGQKFTLGLEARNLLGTQHEEYQFDQLLGSRTEYNTYRYGRTLSASITAEF
ncbi:MAG: TonB-dependent receptor [Parvularculaceae bacterium]